MEATEVPLVTIPDVSSPTYEERLREAVACGVVPDGKVLQHAYRAAERALTKHLNPFTNKRDCARAAQELQLAADLCRSLASKAQTGA